MKVLITQFSQFLSLSIFIWIYKVPIFFFVVESVPVRDRSYVVCRILISLSYIKSVLTYLHMKMLFTFVWSVTFTYRHHNSSVPQSPSVGATHFTYLNLTAVCPADCGLCEDFQYSNLSLIRVVVTYNSASLVCLLPTPGRWKERMNLSPPPRWPESPLSPFASLEPSHLLMIKKRKSDPQVRQCCDAQQ